MKSYNEVKFDILQCASRAAELKAVPVLFFFNTGVAIMSRTAPAEYDELILHFIIEANHGGSIDHRRSWWSADRPFGVVVHLGLAEGLVG